MRGLGPTLSRGCLGIVAALGLWACSGRDRADTPPAADPEAARATNAFLQSDGAPLLRLAEIWDSSQEQLAESPSHDDCRVLQSSLVDELGDESLTELSAQVQEEWTRQFVIGLQTAMLEGLASCATDAKRAQEHFHDAQRNAELLAQRLREMSE